MHVFERRDQPYLVFHNWAAKGGNIILAGERLLGFGCRILDREACVERRGTSIEGPGAVPFVGSALGGNHNGAGRRTTRIGVLVGGTEIKFLNDIGRKVLQKS